ncbi:uncharacterized protein A4U43_C01F32300 [Asparagus officinalis]|uniref:Subtilisin-like protease n=1 Tax=Asparagus officinalis TaxID=4686 RepID=A0A5P1FX93_ASPOF|nr:subtilisin-like protease SBT1.2 [Asparagus officinalis]ONK81730.1 uncharacterized protein A4U43_C01F32300 [Asparagus officinalis]
MDKHKFIFLLSLFILLSAFLFSYFNNPSLPTKHKEIPFSSGLKSVVTDNQPEVYIVSVMPADGTGFNNDLDRENWYKSFLPSTHLPTGEPRMIYSYKHASSGFAARLTRKEVQDMESVEGFLSAHPDQIHTPCTTYSPEYLGLNQKEDGLWKRTKYGGGVIIGVVDYGIRPTHHSFKGDGVPSPPKSWGGKCIPPITCSNKIIGALGLRRGQETSAEDDDGHGTHTASTAAGNFVDGASILGLAWGTASGTAPHAHLAIYKVCFDQCVASDIMGGIDRAMDDGVDLLSISLSNEPKEFYENGIARSSFRATVKKRDKKEGILVTAVAGNLPGSKRSSVHHDAPWVLTVGASGTSRILKVIVKLHNGMELVGESAYQIHSATDELPLVYPGAITRDLGTAFCKPGTLKEDMVKGKMVICKLGKKFEDVIAQGRTVHAAGGAAMVLMNPKSYESTIISFPHVIAACVLSYHDSLIIKDYAATDNPKAAFSFEGTKYDNPAPRVGAFSGRGPSIVNGHILKPDIIAPGVNILAASKDNDDEFMMRFGTSMAVPHIAGVAALIKSNHPDWSPAEVKSAIMTSSNFVNREGKPILDEKSDIANFFDMGAGHLFTPEEANDPGLVYDTKMEDYFRYLCGLYDDDKKVAAATGYGVECKVYGKIQPEQLNYPSIGLSMKHDGPKVVIRRKVKNVGPETEYTADIKMRSQEEEVKVEAHPKTIKFTKYQKEADFEVHVTPVKGKKDSLVEAHLTWVSKIERSTNPKKHYEVRSPISITLT